MENCVTCYMDEAELELWNNNKKIEKQLKKDFKESQSMKILLLGTGEAGKSTFIKQMKILHGQEFTDAELTDYRIDLMNNVVDSIKTIIKGMEQLQIDYENEDVYRLYVPSIMEYAHDNKSDTIDANIVACIEEVWKDEGVKECYNRRGQLQLGDSASFYLDSLPRFKQQDFSPTNEDILMARKMTTGVLEYQFKLGKKAESLALKLIDVGGQRGERKKWISAFEGLTALIFLTAISEYDQVLLEDNKTSRLSESRNVFREIISYSVFRNTHVILFLNKKDVFEKKFQSGNFTQYVTKYEGSLDDPEEAINYVKENIFLKVFKENAAKELYMFATVAIDPKNIENVFSSVRNIIFTQAAEDLNLH